jgi:hypothetical protein
LGNEIGNICEPASGSRIAEVHLEADANEPPPPHLACHS